MSETPKRIARFLLGLFVSLIPAGFLPRYSVEYFKQKSEVEQVVQEFHEQYNKGQLEEACNTVYWCSLSQSESHSWNSFAQKVRDRAGAFKGVRFSKIEPSSRTPYISAVYVSSFEKTKCEEIFNLSDLDEPFRGGAKSQGHLRVFSYQVVINGLEVQ